MSDVKGKRVCLRGCVVVSWLVLVAGLASAQSPVHLSCTLSSEDAGVEVVQLFLFTLDEAAQKVTRVDPAEGILVRGEGIWTQTAVMTVSTSVESNMTTKSIWTISRVDLSLTHRFVTEMDPVFAAKAGAVGLAMPEMMDLRRVGVCKVTPKVERAF